MFHDASKSRLRSFFFVRDCSVNPLLFVSDYARAHTHTRTHTHTIEGSLEAKRPTIWTDEKAEAGRVREEKRRRAKIREEKEPEERRCRCAKR